ncbi:MAG: class F sortase [Chloroflexi bacterium]|nr:class F sortase [Chloroflexota bacterium]
MNALQEITASIGRAAGHAADWWSRQSPTTRWSVAGVAAGVIAGVAIALTISGGGGEPPVTVATVTRTPAPVVATPATETPTPEPAATDTPAPTATPTTATATPTSTPPPTPTPPPATATPIASPTATATATAAPGQPTYYSLEALRDAVGEAPDATLGRMRIPILGIDAAVGQRLVTGDIMEDPTGPSDVVWYDLSPWEGLGGVPGGGQNAVFAGHVDYLAEIPWADARYHGEAVFYDLQLLAVGDLIEVEIGNVTHRYEVTWLREVSRDLEGGWRPILSADVEVDSITLITCSGDFNRVSRTYSHRFIVRAERLDPET